MMKAWTPERIKGLTCLLMVVWTCFIGTSYHFNMQQEKQTLRQTAVTEARSSINKDLVYRRWATQHGGVYVPITDLAPPNPYLADIPGRDIVTREGQQLTLINPAYMTRQVHELGKRQYGERGHITSLTPIRPENAPDPWEAKTLKAFDSGVHEISSLETIDGEPYLRFMKPLITEEGCLKCHADQGYKVGDIRGGISVSVPYGPYGSMLTQHRATLASAHILLAAFGLIVIGFGGRSFAASQDSLAKSEKRHRLALDAARDAIWEWDIRTNEKYFSPQFSQIVGYDVDDPAFPHKYEAWADLIHPDDSEYVMKALSDHLEHHEKYDVEYRYLHKSGEYRWQRSIGETERNKSGKPTKMYGSISDIHNEKLAEIDLQKSRYYLQKSQEMGKIGTWEIDISNNRLIWTDENCRIFGVEPGTIADYELFISKVHPGDRVYVNQEWQAALTGRPYDIRHRILVDGKNLWVRAKADFIFDEQGHAVKAIGFTQDITDIKKAEDVRQEYLEQLETIAAEVPGMIFKFSQEPSGKYSLSYVSNAIKGIFGLSPEDVLTDASAIFTQIHSEDRPGFMESIIDSAAELSPWHQKFRVCDAQGDIRWISAHSTPRKEEGRIVWYGFLTDISAEVEAEKHRLELENQLQQRHKMEAIGVMAGGMAHNFNNNLAIILGNLELAQMKTQRAQNFDQYITNAKTALLRSRDLIKDILVYSRNDEQIKKPLQLAEVVRETFQLLRSTNPTTVDFQVDIHPDASQLLITGSESQIQEVLINLCNNAVQAMREVGTLSVRLDKADRLPSNLKSRTGKNRERYIRLSVTDSGCGIPEHLRDKIFDPFFTTKEIDQGTGMGLATVQGIVESHEGSIQIQSQIDHGTTFELFFPVSNAELLTPSASAFDELNGSGNILFVDDEQMLVEVGKIMLETLGYHVRTATSAAEALEFVKSPNEQIDLVLTDQTMPGMTGKDLAREIKRMNPDLPIILSTGFSNQISEETAKEYGISAFCMKPLEIKELGMAIRSCLGH